MEIKLKSLLIGSLSLLEKYKSYIGFVLLLILPAIFTFFFVKEKEVKIPHAATSLNFEEVKGKIFVEISGQVKSPGVYELEDQEIVFNLIEKAGGFTESADKYFIAKNINLSKKLEAEEKIYIPQEGENSSKIMAGESEDGKVNINTGSVAELDTLPGVGESTAEKIIAARPFKSIDDLKNVSGIGVSKFEDIKNLVSL